MLSGPLNSDLVSTKSLQDASTKEEGFATERNDEKIIWHRSYGGRKMEIFWDRDHMQGRVSHHGVIRLLPVCGIPKGKITKEAIPAFRNCMKNFAVFIRSDRIDVRPRLLGGGRRSFLRLEGKKLKNILLGVKGQIDIDEIAAYEDELKRRLKVYRELFEKSTGESDLEKVIMIWDNYLTVLEGQVKQRWIFIRVIQDLIYTSKSITCDDKIVDGIVDVFYRLGAVIQNAIERGASNFRVEKLTRALSVILGNLVLCYYANCVGSLSLSVRKDIYNQAKKIGEISRDYLDIRYNLELVVEGAKCLRDQKRDALEQEVKKELRKETIENILHAFSVNVGVSGGFSGPVPTGIAGVGIGVQPGALYHALKERCRKKSEISKENDLEEVMLWYPYVLCLIALSEFKKENQENMGWIKGFGGEGSENSWQWHYARIDFLADVIKYSKNVTSKQTAAGALRACYGIYFEDQNEEKQGTDNIRLKLFQVISELIEYEDSFRAEFTTLNGVKEEVESLFAAIVPASAANPKIALSGEPEICKYNSPISFFLARDTECGEIQQKYDNEENVVVLCGIVGVGKTQLACKFVEEHLSEYSLIWTFSAGKKAKLRAGFRALAEKLGYGRSIKNLLLWEDIFAEVKKGLQKLNRRNKKWLLCLDNASPTRVILQMVSQLQELGKNGNILITSRRRDWERASLIEISEFAEPHSINLLDTILEDDKNKLESRALAKKLGYLPLALHQAGSYVKTYIGRNAEDESIEYHKWYEEKAIDSGLIWKVDSRYYSKTVYHSFTEAIHSAFENINYECVKTEDVAIAKETLNVCAFFSGETDIPAEWITNWLKKEKKVESDVRVKGILALLNSRSMIRWDNRKEIKMHCLMQQVVRHHLSTKEKADSIREAFGLITKAYKDYKDNITHGKIVMHMRNILQFKDDIDFMDGGTYDLWEKELSKKQTPSRKAASKDAGYRSEKSMPRSRSRSRSKSRSSSETQLEPVCSAVLLKDFGDVIDVKGGGSCLFRAVDLGLKLHPMDWRNVSKQEIENFKNSEDHQVLRNLVVDEMARREGEDDLRRKIKVEVGNCFTANQNYSDDDPNLFHTVCSDYKEKLTSKRNERETYINSDQCIKDYIQYMRDPSTWGTDIELGILADLKEICLLVSDSSSLERIGQFGHSKSREIHLLFEKSGHYKLKLSKQ